MLKFLKGERIYSVELLNRIFSFRGSLKLKKLYKEFRKKNFSHFSTDAVLIIIVAMKIIFIKLVLFSVLSCTAAFNGFTDLYNTHEEPRIITDDYKSTISFVAKEKWMTQKLDHFNPNESREWNMRYLENDRFHKSGGPIFVFVGGEWEITPALISTGVLFETAKELDGMLFYTEHRFYGKSHPANNTSTKNLEFLTVEQALADLAHFIESIKASSDNFTASGVILAGASYSASVAAWARMKYPHLVNGAWSSSGPMLAKMDFFEYNEVMTESIRAIGGKKCLRRIENAFKQLEGFFADTEPKILLKIFVNFKLCAPLKLNRDIPFFIYELLDAISGLVQSHKTGDIEIACEFLLDEKHSDDVAALGAWLNHDSKKKCQNMNYDATVKHFKNVTWGSPANKQLRQWTYQTCDNFGWFQTMSSEKQIFGMKYPPIEYYTQLCADIFNNTFNFNSIKDNVDRTNKVLGGLNPNVTNVYFTHGQLDPWRAIGIQADLNPDTPAVVIDSYAHVPDLFPVSHKDTQQMKESKLRVKRLIRKWLREA